MEIIENHSNIDLKSVNSVVVLGNFDGVHLGHRQVINKAKQIASSSNLPLILVTFEPHPISLFRPDIKNYRLTNLQHKRELLKNFSIDYLLEINFNREFSKISANDFLENVLINKLKAKHIIVGYDFAFGNKKQGDGNFLQEKSTQYDYYFYQVKAFGKTNNSENNYKKDEIYSSTLIRQSLKEGDIIKASKILGRNYSIRGQIIKGKQLGRTIGFPTINVDYNDYFLPQNGVYSAIVKIDNNTHHGVLNLGIKPSIGDEKISLEMNIFDFNDDIYGKYVQVEFLEKIRNEIKFNSLNDLKKQIKVDCETAKLQLNNHGEIN